MHVNKKAACFSFVVLFVLLTFFYLRVNSSPDLSTATTTGLNDTAQEIETKIGSPTPTLKVNDVPRMSPKQSVNFDWRFMDKQYQSATNLRAFFYDALQRPENGGYYYASRIRSMCRENISMVGKTLPMLQRQAVDDLAKRCDFSLSELDDADRQFEAKRDLNYVDDPIIAQVISSLMAKDDSTRAALLSKAVIEGNPDVIGSLLFSTANEAVEASITKDPEVASEYAHDIILLVQCRLGADCTSPDSTRNRALCAQHGWCADNVSDSLRGGLGNDFDRLDQLAKQMTKDIRKPNFMPSPPLH